MIDILNYLLALSAVFFGYRIYVSRRNGRAFKEIRPLTVSFGLSSTYKCNFLGADNKQ